MNNTVVLYVHGFKSSSRAVKATQTKDYIHDYEVDLSFDAMDRKGVSYRKFDGRFSVNVSVCQVQP